MNKRKLFILHYLDYFIRFMGLIGGAMLAIAGVIMNWWSGNAGAAIYVAIVSTSIAYCDIYNGSEWT